MTTDLITVEEAATILGITARSVRRRIVAGTLTPAGKLPGQTGAYLLRREDLTAKK